MFSFGRHLVYSFAVFQRINLVKVANVSEKFPAPFFRIKVIQVA